jgi:hypothetical protein
MSRSVRALGISLVLAIAGAAGGYAVGATQTDDPVSISMALPVVAEDPSYPVVEYDVEPDPGIAALAPGLRLRQVVLRGNGRRLQVSVPRGWSRGGIVPNATFSVPSNPSNTYQLRIGIFDGLSSPRVESLDRVNALRDAEANDDMQNVVVESDDGDEFVATYLQDGYRRVTMERFLTLGGTTAVATVAVVGRERDREGMADLLERVSTSLTVL